MLVGMIPPRPDDDICVLMDRYFPGARIIAKLIMSPADNNLSHETSYWLTTLMVFSGVWSLGLDLALT